MIGVGLGAETAGEVASVGRLDADLLGQVGQDFAAPDCPVVKDSGRRRELSGPGRFFVLGRSHRDVIRLWSDWYFGWVDVRAERVAPGGKWLCSGFKGYPHSDLIGIAADEASPKRPATLNLWPGQLGLGFESGAA